jgi:iron-sulfur cluster assembly protein
MISASPRAVSKIASNLERRGNGVGLRIGVRTTGCSGMAYTLEYLDSRDYEEGVTDFYADHILIRVDNRDLVYIDGMIIDYAREGFNEGFKFLNPNVKDECGCGESFRV